MNKEHFTQILKQPQDMTVDDVNVLNNLIGEYPYFQPARALYLKGLKNQSSFKYNKELKITAAYTADRSILFDYITSETFNQNEISRQISQNFEQLKTIDVHDVEELTIEESFKVDEALKQQVRSSKEVLNPNLFEEKSGQTEVESRFLSEETEDESIEIHSTKTSVSDRKEPTPEETLLLGKPLEFDKSETHSFSEWLKLTKFKPIVRVNAFEKTEREEENEETINNSNSKTELIEQFLANNPKIVPNKEVSPKPKFVEENHQGDSLMTETLARIYLEQKNFEKAIQSYKILSLKYPEKSGFFADQIKAVKKLQENNSNQS